MRNRRRKNDRAGAPREIGGGVADGLVARCSFEEELSGLPIYRLGDHAGGGSIATGRRAVAWSFREVRDVGPFWSGAHAVEFIIVRALRLEHCLDSWHGRVVGATRGSDLRDTASSGT